MRIVSWNINGIRAAVRKGFLDWLDECNADIIALQEVRAADVDLPPEITQNKDWHSHFVAAERKGYSGVGLLSKFQPESVESSLGSKKFDIEGRLQIAKLGKLTVVNGYFPNGNGKDRDNSRVPYKIGFYKKVYNTLNKAKLAGEPILVMGDFNTAHQAIDLARPKTNKKTSGFLPEEREEMSRWIRGGWTDTFRHFHPDALDKYTWWSQRFGVRERNVGWRIDYIMASEGALPYIKSAEIHADTMGSDHCPISIEIDDAITE